MKRNKTRDRKKRPSALPTQQSQRLGFKGNGITGTIVWSPLDEDEAQRLVADIERLLVDRVLTVLREP